MNKVHEFVKSLENVSEFELKEIWEAARDNQPILFNYYHVNMDKKSKRQIYIDEIKWMLADAIMYGNKQQVGQRATVYTQNGSVVSAFK